MPFFITATFLPWRWILLLMTSQVHVGVKYLHAIQLGTTPLHPHLSNDL